MLKRLDLPLVGAGQHRSGWPYCMESLQPLFTDNAEVLLDDFVERTFFYDRGRDNRRIHRQPWVGIMHHPPDLPEWYMSALMLQNLQTEKRWQQSLPYLRLIIVTGDNLRDWCQQQWPQIPCVTIKHPTGLPQAYWSPSAFLASKQVVQVGWFLRNMVAIQQAKVPTGFSKLQLPTKNEWVDSVTKICRRVYTARYPNRSDNGTVQILSTLSDLAYDMLLSKSVVLLEVISAVANNTVVECIARNTPICINRHPGPVNYLGADYPLFYDDFSEIEHTLRLENVIAAHKYLVAMDKWWLSGQMFCEQVRAACLAHVPECQAAI